MTGHYSLGNSSDLGDVAMTRISLLTVPQLSGQKRLAGHLSITTRATPSKVLLSLSYPFEEVNNQLLVVFSFTRVQI